MPVSATVPVSCTAAAGTSMAFGNLTTTLALAVSQADTTGTLTVTCTSGASYSIVAGDGNNYSSGWRMANGSSQYVTYGLYSDAGRTTSFPRSGTALAGTGTGAAQTVTAYGRVPAQTAGGSGSFTDSVTFTVTY
ncbi:MAG TPA: spore coat protein U domain-containing protein [Variovorax sp.]|nr:spore coat protein U domain-containing protein [Variovorax sp.]